MAIEHLGRLVIQNDTQANVEAVTGALVEMVLGRNTATGAIGYSVDGGTTWIWLPITTGMTSATLDDLTDVVITGPVIGQLLHYNGSNWENSSVTVPAAEPLTNGDATTPELLFDDNGDVLIEG